MANENIVFFFSFLAFIFVIKYNFLLHLCVFYCRLFFFFNLNRQFSVFTHVLVHTTPYIHINTHIHICELKHLLVLNQLNKYKYYMDNKRLQSYPT